jgi:hypothetical protein
MKRWFWYRVKDEVQLIDFLNKHNLKPDDLKIISFSEGSGNCALSFIYYAEKKLI